MIPGMYADAAITLERRNGALAIPIQAIDHGANGETVDVVNAAHEVEIRPVRTGLESTNWVEGIAGLREGDLVIVSDRAALKPGMSVDPHPVEVTEYQPQNQ